MAWLLLAILEAVALDVLFEVGAISTQTATWRCCSAPTTTMSR